MKYIYTFLLLSLFFNLSHKGFATDHNNKGQQTEDKGVKRTIHILIKEGIRYQQLENNLKSADSLLDQAVKMAEMTYDNTLILKAYNAYLEFVDGGVYNNKRMALLPKAERILPQINDLSLISETYCNIADVYISNYNFDKAIEYSYKSFNTAELSGNSTLKARSYISIGNAMEGKNQLLEAFRNYLLAMNLAEKLKDPDLLNDVHKVLSRFYNLSKDYDNAIKHKLIQIELLDKQNPIDSLAEMWLQFELEEISYSSMKTVNIMNMDRILQFADNHDKKRLRDFTLTLFRSYLIYTERLDKLKKLYFEKYPAEFEKLQKDNPAMYHRIMALFLEKDGKTAEALQNWIESEKLLTGESNKIFKANFYIRYGQFLKRQNNTAEAIKKFENAWQLSNEASYLEYALTASEELELAYVSQNDYRNAYKYTRLHLQLHDSLSNITKKDDLLRLEIDNTTRQREETLQREQEETERRHNLQYTAIIIIMGIIFVILLMLGSFSVPKWSIQAIGFISFILLFEFIILIADQKIHDFTHGEPWKILAIKIVLIGIMMPLHHFTERRVIHYLIHKKVVSFKVPNIRKFLKELFTHEEEDL